MANTYHQMYIQTVFAVKYRDAVIAKPLRSELFANIGNLINETGCKTIIVNGVADHVHCFFGLKPTGMADIQVNISQDNMKGFPIPIPSRNEQNKIILNLEKAFETCNDLESSIKQSQQQNAKAYFCLVP